MKKIFFYIISFMFYLSPASAEHLNASFQIECMPEINYLIIKYLTFQGFPMQKDFMKQADSVYKKYGIMYIPSLIERTKDFDLIKIDSFNGSCQLGNKKFDIIITPIIGNKDECSGYYSMAVTVKLGEKLLVDNLLFQRCHYKDEYTNEIIINNDKYGYVGIKGFKMYHGWYGNEDFTPITDKTYYTKKWSWYGM